MTAVLSSREIERFRSIIAQRLGLWFDDAKLEYLAQILERRLETNGEPAELYLTRLDAAAKSTPEQRAIAQELTVGETYFFRHMDQFRAFSEVALPARAEARRTVKQLRFLSAGCSSGEEAYSLAILTGAHLPAAAAWEVVIRGVDVNPLALERARLARYSSWALRETPDDIQRRYFIADGREFALAPAIRGAASFEEENLVGDEQWGPEAYDVIFCRNVLMYFTPESARRVVTRFARALAPGGYLFLGHAENLRGLSADFELCHTHSTFYYRRKDVLRRLPTPPELVVPTDGERSALPLDWTSTWLETVQRSSDRIHALTAKSSQPPPRAAAAATAVLDLSLALELLAHEKFAEALGVLHRLPPTLARDADAVLLRAALLTHSDRLEAAELACAELLALDGLNAGAHYLRALCQERQGDTRAAIESSQAATYLDPAFAMPHLHLGLMARRMGERATAQRELSQAARLLLREDPARLLLFGGGFNREGLVALCRAELDRLGGAA